MEVERLSFVGRSPRGSGAHTVVARPPSGRTRRAPRAGEWDPARAPRHPRGTQWGEAAAPPCSHSLFESQFESPTRPPTGTWRRPLGVPVGRRDAPSGSARRAEWDLGGAEWEVGQHRVGPASRTLPRPTRPRGGHSTLKWRPLRWRPTSRAGAAGREPDERTGLQCKHIKAAHTPPTRPERGRTRRNEPSEVAGRRARTSDRGEVPPARCCVQLTCLPRGRPALVPAACCLLSPLPSSQALVSPELTMRRGRLRPRQKVRPGPLPHRTLHRCSNRACGRDAVAVGAAVPHVQRGRSRPEASLLPLAHRRRRSVRCGAHLLMQQGRCGPPCGSRTRRYPPIASTAGERSQVNSGELGSSGRGILTQSDTHKAPMACEARI